MIQYNNFLMKREQSRAGSRFAECEKSRLKAKILITLALLLTAVTGAWADYTVTWEGTTLQGIAARSNTATTSQTVEGITVTASNGDFFYNTTYPKGPVVIASLSADNGLVFSAENNIKSIAITFTEMSYYGGSVVLAGAHTYQVSPAAKSFALPKSDFFIGITKVVFTLEGDAPVAGPEVIELKPDETGKVWTLAEMPANNIELQVEYYPGMLVKPTNLVGGTLSIEGLTDTTLPAGFEKDAEGNIYVKKDTKFTVKAVPAEGYHLVGWSDDATIKELEREFTMTDDDFTITATFSNEYDIAFQAANALTIQSGKATVKVGDAEKTLGEDGKLSVKSGQTVTLTAATGYKFRSVEAKKAVKLQSITISGVTVYYAEGESWSDAIKRDENKNSGLFIREGNRVHHPDYGQLVDSNTQPVLPDAKINANESYNFIN